MRTERSLQAPFRRHRRLLAGLAVGGLLVIPAATALPAAHADSVGDKQAEATQVAADLAALDAKLMDLAAQYETGRHELSKIEAQVEEAQARADRTQAELDQREAELRDFSIDAYVGGTDSPDLAVLLTADGGTAPQKKVYLQVTNGNRRDLLDGLGAAQSDAERDAEQLRAAQAEAARVTEQMDAARTEAAKAADSQRSINDRVQGELATLVKQEADRRAEEQRIAAERAAAAATTTTTPRATTGTTGGSSSSTQSPTARSESPAPGPVPPSNPSPPRSGLSGAISAAVSKVGSSYVWGAEGPNTFDCSGLMVWAFRQVGISLPHYSGAIYDMTARVSRADLQPGDFVFWGGGGSEHVALYMGNNQLIHAFGSGGTDVTRLDGWWKSPTGYGRLR